jgi:hypothetical protein
MNSKRDIPIEGRNEIVDYQPGDTYRFSGWCTDTWGDYIWHVRIPASVDELEAAFPLKEEWIDTKIDLRRGNQLRSLVEFLDELGAIPKKYTPESREEDLKIIHRLIDKLPSKGDQ